MPPSSHLLHDGRLLRFTLLFGIFGILRLRIFDMEGKRNEKHYHVAGNNLMGDEASVFFDRPKIMALEMISTTLEWVIARAWSLGL